MRRIHKSNVEIKTLEKKEGVSILLPPLNSGCSQCLEMLSILITAHKSGLIKLESEIAPANNESFWQNLSLISDSLLLPSITKARKGKQKYIKLC